jgi:hypothetical protein
MNGVKEVQSLEELKNLIESAEQADKIQIWQFNTNEWLRLNEFQKKNPFISKKEKTSSVVIGNKQPLINTSPAKRKGWLKKSLYIIGLAISLFLVFNFTRIKWKKADPVNIAAIRPDNVPSMDIDSLIYEIENERGVSLDRSTKTNLRLRNTWPERILLQLAAEQETSSIGSRYFNVDLSIDNTTGFNIDNAVVKLLLWKGNKVHTMDTIQFNSIGYDKVQRRKFEKAFRGDSISISFESIKAKAFNFCYSAGIKNNSGNYNDRWFCRQ